QRLSQNHSSKHRALAEIQHDIVQPKSLLQTFRQRAQEDRRYYGQNILQPVLEVPREFCPAPKQLLLAYDSDEIVLREPRRIALNINIEFVRPEQVARNVQRYVVSLNSSVRNRGHNRRGPQIDGKR